MFKLYNEQLFFSLSLLGDIIASSFLEVANKERLSLRSLLWRHCIQPQMMEKEVHRRLLVDLEARLGNNLHNSSYSMGTVTQLQ